MSTVKKGMKITVIGKLNFDVATGGPRIYEANGEKKASFEMTAFEIVFPDGAQPQAEQGDLPF
jgi:hypothetical protein